VGTGLAPAHSMRKASTQRQTNLVDLLDRVLDKGLILEARADISVAGISLIGAEAQILVASLDAYLAYSETAAISCSTGRTTASPDVGLLPNHGAARRRPRRKHSHQMLTCMKGCSFQDSIAGPRQSAGTVECPYGPGVCIVKPLTGFRPGRKHK
jgi:hypothetical protein